MLAYHFKIFTVLLACSVFVGCSAQGKSNSAGNNQSAKHQNEQLSTIELQEDVKRCDGLIWSGEVGAGRNLLWESNEIFISEVAGKTGLFLPSFTRLHQSDVDRLKNLKDIDALESDFLANKHTLRLDSSALVAIKSVVGDIVTFEIEYSSVLEGSPASHSTWWLPLDLSKTKNIEPFSEQDTENVDVSGIVNLIDIYPESDLLAAVIENSSIAQSLKNQNRSISPRSIRELLENENKYNDNPRIEVGSEGYFLTQYSFEHFVFDRLENGKIVAQLALVNFVAANTHQNRYVEVILPVPDSLRDQFIYAADYKSGFLGIDSDRASRGCATRLNLSTMVNIPR